MNNKITGMYKKEKSVICLSQYERDVTKMEDNNGECKGCKDIMDYIAKGHTGIWDCPECSQEIQHRYDQSGCYQNE